VDSEETVDGKFNDAGMFPKSAAKKKSNWKKVAVKRVMKKNLNKCSELEVSE